MVRFRTYAIVDAKVSEYLCHLSSLYKLGYKNLLRKNNGLSAGLAVPTILLPKILSICKLFFSFFNVGFYVSYFIFYKIVAKKTILFNFHKFI
jgi:hypothetical protein